MVPVVPASHHTVQFGFQDEEDVRMKTKDVLTVHQSVDWPYSTEKKTSLVLWTLLTRSPFCWCVIFILPAPETSGSTVIHAYYTLGNVSLWHSWWCTTTQATHRTRAKLCFFLCWFTFLYYMDALHTHSYFSPGWTYEFTKVKLIMYPTFCWFSLNVKY